MKVSDIIPSRLVVLRRYVDRELAEADRDQLIDAGIPAYLKRVMADAARSLMVPEEHVDAALALLGESDASAEAAVADEPHAAELATPIADGALQCLRCQSIDVAPLPAYAGLTFIVGAAASVYVFFYGRADAVAPLVGATILISVVVYAKSPRWRCRTCGLVYGRPGSAGKPL
jgi:hypothetical protein